MKALCEKEFKTYITRDGGLKILDPDTTLIPLLKKLNPDFSIQSVPPPSGFVPAFQRMRKIYIPDLRIDDLERIDTYKLWEIHEQALTRNLKPTQDKDMANLLELKEELCRRSYQSCTLCPWRCGVNRFRKAGRCGLKGKTFFSSCFTHISEEAVINPALNIKLCGCNMDCSFCHTWENLKVDPQAEELNENIWKDLSTDETVTLEFVGGEPLVSLLPVLEVLSFAPYTFGLPIVWNSNGYMSEVASSLLQGVMDVFLPDLKYGNDKCAFEISSIHNYMETVKKSIETMVKAGVRTIVRILVLPGHIECCHKPAIECLSQFNHYDNLWMSILDQYVPEYRVREIKELSRCPVPEEIRYVESLIEKSGLKDVNKTPKDFWAGK